MKKLSLEVLTPQGIFMKEDDVEKVVIFRLEKKHKRGSEIAIFPRHAAMLVRVGKSPIRYHKEKKDYEIEVDGGFVEVKDNIVSVLVPTAKQSY